MEHTKQPRYNLDTLLAEIPEDEAICRAVPRILSQADIKRLIESSRLRREKALAKGSPHEE